MKIHIHTDSQFQFNLDPLIKIFDFWCAFRQWKNKSHNWEVADTIVIDEQVIDTNSDLNIGFFQQPNEQVLKNFDKLDLIFFDQFRSPLENGSEFIHNCLINHQNCYFFSSSKISVDHPLYDKILWATCQVDQKDYFTRPFYPQYYIQSENINQPRNGMILINGANRYNRNFFTDCLSDVSLQKLKIHSKWNSLIEIEPSAFESAEDTKFRNFLEKKYQTLMEQQPYNDYNYYENFIPIGIDKKFGTINMGYFPIEEYFTHSCVVYPESTWINNTVMLTEKSIKCFVCKTVPWPFAGAHCNQLLNDLGYQTAWNLLPPVLQSYDYELDHEKRYIELAKAVTWADHHPEIWNSDIAKQLIENNYNKFFSNNHDMVSVKQLDHVLNKTLLEKNERRH